MNPKRYLCDKQCIGWKTRNICAHCIAAAEDNGELEGFLVWFSSTKGKECNLTKVVYHDTYIPTCWEEETDFECKLKDDYKES